MGCPKAEEVVLFRGVAVAGVRVMPGFRGYPGVAGCTESGDAPVPALPMTPRPLQVCGLCPGPPRNGSIVSRFCESRGGRAESDGRCCRERGPSPGRLLGYGGPRGARGCTGWGQIWGAGGHQGPCNGGTQGMEGAGMDFWVHSGVREMAGLGNTWVMVQGDQVQAGAGWLLGVTRASGESVGDRHATVSPSHCLFPGWT